MSAALCIPLMLTVSAATAAPALRIGLGGEFIAGWEGMVARMGLPHERIWIQDLSKLEVLQQYDVVFVSSPSVDDSAFPGAFRAYIESGGRGVLEMFRGARGDLLPGAYVQGGYPLGMRVLPGAPVLTPALSHEDVYPCIPTALWSIVAPDDADVIPLACYTADGIQDADANNPLATGDGQPALSLIRMGEGELVFCGSAIGFAVGWRVPDDEPIAQQIIHYLVRDKAPARLAPGDGFEDAIDPANGHPTEEGDDVSQPEADDPAERPEPDRPAFFEAVDTGAWDACNLTADVIIDPAAEGAEGPSLLLDVHRPDLAYALALAPHAVRVARLGPGREQVLATHEVPEGISALLIKLRPGRIGLVVNDEPLGDWEALGATPGATFVRRRIEGLRLSELTCQPVFPVQFADDFSREEADLGQWEPLAGAWNNIGLEHPDQSVNGFTLFGEGPEPSLIATGHWFWDDYTFGAAAQPLADETTVGLAFAVQAADRYWMLRVPAQGDAQLVRVTPDGEEILASAPCYRATNHWMRLAVRAMAGEITALVDGRPLMSCLDPGAPNGRIGLHVAGGRAAFDDVDVVPSATTSAQGLPQYKGEGTPTPVLPINLGPTDYMTWAGRAVEWKAVESQPSLLWHRGTFFGDVALAIRLPEAAEAGASYSLLLGPECDASQAAKASLEVLDGQRARVTFAVPGSAPSEAMIDRHGEEPWVLRLARRGGQLAVRVGGEDLLSAWAHAATVRAAVEINGPPVRVADLGVTCANIRDYTFGTAPTDWRFVSGRWEVRARWACDDRWSWLTGASEGVASVWNKHCFDGDMAVDYYIGVKHKGPGGDETERTRDLNAVFCGDGEDVMSGYTVIMGGASGVVTQLLRNGQVIAEAPEVVIPRQYAVHHQWEHFRFEKAGRRLRFYLEDRLVFDLEDPEPLSGGYIGLWTRNSAICLPRVSVYYEHEGPSAYLPAE